MKKRNALAALMMGTLLLFGCGKPKTYKLDRMYAINPMGQFYVAGKVLDVGNGIMKFKLGDVEYSNMKLSDETGEYVFYFLPSAHERQPSVGDQVKLTVRFVLLDASSFGGGERAAPVVDKIELQ